MGNHFLILVSVVACGSSTTLPAMFYLYKRGRKVVESVLFQTNGSVLIMILFLKIKVLQIINSRSCRIMFCFSDERKRGFKDLLREGKQWVLFCFGGFLFLCMWDLCADSVFDHYHYLLTYLFAMPCPVFVSVVAQDMGIYGLTSVAYFWTCMWMFEIFGLLCKGPTLTTTTPLPPTHPQTHIHANKM